MNRDVVADLLIKRQESSGLDKLRVESSRSIFFYIAFLLFLVTIAAYGGIFFLDKRQVSAQEDLLDEIRLKEEELRPELLSQIFLLESRLRNMRELIVKHVRYSNVLKFLELNTHPQVRFSNFTFSTDSRRLGINGEAGNYAILAEQVGIFERNPQVEKVEFGGLSLGSGGRPGFNLTVIVKSSLLTTR